MCFSAARALFGCSRKASAESDIGVALTVVARKYNVKAAKIALHKQAGSLSGAVSFTSKINRTEIGYKHHNYLSMMELTCPRV